MAKASSRRRPPLSNAPRVGLVSIGDPNAMRTWSGTLYFMGRALDSVFGDVLRIGPLKAPLLNGFEIYGKVLRKLCGLDFSAVHAGPVAAQYAANAKRAIRAAGVDIVFAPAGSALAAGVPDDVPMIYSSDATFKQLECFHPHYRKLSKSTRRDGEQREREAIARAAMLLYPTEWVARSAIEDYGADRGKIRIAPYGANIFDEPTLEELGTGPRDGICRLLFIGVDWREKGAGIAVDALSRLRANGVNAELTICGCTPPRSVDAPGLTIISFLRKSDPAEFAQLQALYRKADFFLLPTRAECYGIAFCEASSYGLPSIGTAVGGVPGVVVEGVNGHLLPPSAGGAEYAALIGELYYDPARLAKLRASSRREFEERLNWTAWGRSAAQAVAAALSSAR